jgi:hypothetical protein
MGRLTPLILAGLALFAAGGVAVLLITGRGGWLFCWFGLHQWERTVAGRGRDVRHVVKCVHCEKVWDEG